MISTIFARISRTIAGILRSLEGPTKSLQGYTRSWSTLSNEHYKWRSTGIPPKILKHIFKDSWGSSIIIIKNNNNLIYSFTLEDLSKNFITIILYVYVPGRILMTLRRPLLHHRFHGGYSLPWSFSHSSQFLPYLLDLQATVVWNENKSKRDIKNIQSVYQFTVKVHSI